MPQPVSDDRSDGLKMDLTVLFVDDESELLELYEIHYGTEYEVLTARNGTEALEQFGDHVDVAFIDRRMPGMSGDEIIQEIRDRGYQTPIGIISAVDPDVEPAVDPDVYLTKPINESEVHATIDQHTA